MTPSSPLTSRPGASLAERGLNRLDVFFASRIFEPCGIAA
jgi:hypothetical protein